MKKLITIICALSLMACGTGNSEDTPTDEMVYDAIMEIEDITEEYDYVDSTATEEMDEEAEEAEYMDESEE